MKKKILNKIGNKNLNKKKKKKKKKKELYSSVTGFELF